MTSVTLVSAPARLHFGLFSIGNLTDVEFGGAGLMIDGPRTRISARPGDRFTVQVDTSICEPESREELASTIRGIVSTWFGNVKHSHAALQAFSDLDQLPVALKLESVPRRHAGFGSGTQLAFSAALAVTRQLGLTVPSVTEMAAATERGKRSAIGSYGFWRGGFLVDRGKSNGIGLAKLDLQLEFPVDWPIVTLVGAPQQFFSGNVERESFARLEPTTPEHRAAMISRIRDQTVPGILNQDYDQFAESLYEFGRKSGEMFAAVQQGAYNGPSCALIVDRVRAAGIAAVGQSSWGPCIFAICRNRDEAERLVNTIQSDAALAGVTIQQHSADNQGVQVSAHSLSSQQNVGSK